MLLNNCFLLIFSQFFSIFQLTAFIIEDSFQGKVFFFFHFPRYFPDIQSNFPTTSIWFGQFCSLLSSISSTLFIIFFQTFYVSNYVENQLISEIFTDRLRFIIFIIIEIWMNIKKDVNTLRGYLLWFWRHNLFQVCQDLFRLQTIHRMISTNWYFRRF